jgi:hypothetical protein
MGDDIVARIPPQLQGADVVLRYNGLLLLLPLYNATVVRGGTCIRFFRVRCDQVMVRGDYRRLVRFWSQSSKHGIVGEDYVLIS